MFMKINLKKMLTSKKGSASIILVVAIVVIVGLAGYLFIINKTEPVVQQLTSTSTQTNTIVSPTLISKVELPLDLLKNAEYIYEGKRIQLVNGVYLLKPLSGESQADYFVKLDTDHIVFGDLNNDGQQDAVVILVSRYGGSGTFRQLAIMLSSSDSFNNVANQDLGDRTAINSLKLLLTGVISVDMTPWEGGTGIRKTINYKLSGNKLIETIPEKATGIIKAVYSKSGKNYIDIDYVELNPNWAPGGNSGVAYQNNNPMIRTFQISSSAKFYIGSGTMTSIILSEFQKFFDSSSPATYKVTNPWDIVVTNGVVVSITEHYIP